MKEVPHTTAQAIEELVADVIGVGEDLSNIAVAVIDVVRDLVDVSRDAVLVGRLALGDAKRLLRK